MCGVCRVLGFVRRFRQLPVMVTVANMSRFDGVDGTTRVQALVFAALLKRALIRLVLGSAY